MIEPSSSPNRLTEWLSRWSSRCYSQIISRLGSDERSNQAYHIFFSQAPIGMFHFDLQGHITSCNQAFARIMGANSDKLIGLNLLDLPDQQVLEAVKKVLSGEKGFFTGSYQTFISGKLLYLKAQFQPIYKGTAVIGGVAMMEDLTELISAERSLEYLFRHDSLTGLYNRSYFENAVKQLRVGPGSKAAVLVCDIDGLRIINTTRGEQSGDDTLVTVAGLLAEALQTDAITARIGGDEFAVYISPCQEEEVDRLMARFSVLLDKYNSHTDHPLSISMGAALGSAEDTLSDLLQKAVRQMLREKLYRPSTSQNSLVRTLMSCLEARDVVTEGHSQRIHHLVSSMGKRLQLASARLVDLRLLAEFHDVGKIGIPDKILFKPGPLDDEETRLMRKHTEIGYRIAMQSNELAPIGHLILKHHEWWNGQGYPLGIAGENIPLECRIISIADAYDAMTSDRPYRKAFTRSEALQELARGAGSQFDSGLVERCWPILIENNWENKPDA